MKKIDVESLKSSYIRLCKKYNDLLNDYEKEQTKTKNLEKENKKLKQKIMLKESK